MIEWERYEEYIRGLFGWISSLRDEVADEIKTSQEPEATIKKGCLMAYEFMIHVMEDRASFFNVDLDKDYQAYIKKLTILIRKDKEDAKIDRDNLQNNKDKNKYREGHYEGYKVIIDLLEERAQQYDVPLRDDQKKDFLEARQYGRYSVDCVAILKEQIKEAHKQPMNDLQHGYLLGLQALLHLIKKRAHNYTMDLQHLGLLPMTDLKKEIHAIKRWWYRIAPKARGKYKKDENYKQFTISLAQTIKEQAYAAKSAFDQSKNEAESIQDFYCGYLMAYYGTVGLMQYHAIFNVDLKIMGLADVDRDRDLFL
ncbi:MAG: hypothetical protein VXZ72_01140 [Chlamydiota bacterium]|nr:hypothetical protein [Chlamydiota bacterium]